MNYIDIVIAIILFLFAFKGLRKGLIIEVVTLAAFIVGIYGAMHFSDFTAAHLQEVMEINPKYLNTVAFVLTFILLVMLTVLVNLQWAGFVKAEATKESKLFPYIEQTVPYLYQGFDMVRDFVKENIPEIPEKQQDTTIKQWI